MDQRLHASLVYHLVLAALFVMLAAFVLARRNWVRLLLAVVSWLLGASALALLGTWVSRRLFANPPLTPPAHLTITPSAMNPGS